MASRRRLSCALALGLALLAPVAAEARPGAVIAFVDGASAQDLSLIDRFAAAGMSVGLVSPVTGGWKPAQVALDVSQGARVATRLYDSDLPPLAVRGGRIPAWDAVRRRAADAPADIEPGLLAATLRRSGVDVRYFGSGENAAAAADRHGRVSVVRDRVAFRGGRVIVADIDAGALGLLRDAAAQPEMLIVALQAPSGDRLRLLPAGMAAAGRRGLLRSATTRRDGLIAATDIAPAVLRHMGIAVPGEMQGQEIERVGEPDAAQLRDTAQRLDVVTGRRGPALLAFALLVLVASLAAGRRIALLAVLWLPAVALLAAAARPGEAAEVALLSAGPVALALATDRLVPWPRGPWLPAVVSLAAHAIDLARGSDLIGQAVTGPNPAGGARFYGVGNELETLLSLTVLLGAGAWLTKSEVPGTYRAVKEPGSQITAFRVPVGFGVAGAVAALVLGAGRLGADVGAVITLGAGTAAAVVASLPGGVTRRAVALAVATPVAALAVLALIDLATGGDSHFTRSVLGADEGGDLAEVAQRRFEGSLAGVNKPGGIAATAVAVAVLVALALRRGRVATPLPLAAGLVGCWFAVVAGALGNDSGPLILWVGAAMLGLAVLYAKRPDGWAES